MKNKVNGLVFGLAFLLQLSGCTKDEPDWIRINNTFFLAVNESMRIIDSKGNTLLVTVAAIEETRCPAGTVCPRPGDAKVKVVIEDTRNSQYKTLLCLGDCSPSLFDNQAFTFYNKEYVIGLLEVDPYPAVQNQQDIPKAGLKLYEN